MEKGPEPTKSPALLPTFHRNRNASRRPPKKKIPQFVEMGLGQVEYYAGSGLEFFKEYGAEHMGGKIVSFPLNRCDPLQIEKAGDLRYFFMSAIEGHIPQPGEAVQILNPNIQQIAVVRAKAHSNENKVQIYLGLNTAQGSQCEDGIIFRAQILALQVKNTRHIEDCRSYFLQETKYLNSGIIGQEIKKYLPDPKDFDFKSPNFQQKLKEMFLTYGNEVVFQNGCLVNRTCYWTLHENKLRGRTYNAGPRP